MAKFGRIKANVITAYRSIDVRGKQMSASYGAGALGTEFGPKKYQWEENGDIITELHVDLSGLGCKGDAANDVIGLAAGGAAYLDQYNVATHGVCYKIDVVCLETPHEGTATITTDIDIAFNTSAALEYDGAAGAAEANLGGLAAGGVYVVTTPGLTDTDYMYLVEGDAAATTGVYDGGQIIIRMYGHAVLTA